MIYKTAIHLQDKKRTFEFLTFLFLLLLIGYGIYKNGLIYFIQNQISFMDVFRLFCFPFLGVVFMAGISFGLYKKVSLEEVLLGLLMGVLVPPLFPLWLFIPLAFLFSLFYFFFRRQFSSFAFLNFYKILLLFFTQVFSIGLLNVVERKVSFSYGTLDILFGKGLGGFGITHVFLLFLFYFVLCNYFYYKRDLPIYAVSSYSLLFFLFFFLQPDHFVLKDIFSPSFLFTTIFLLPVNKTSPALNREKGLYGVFYGIFSFVLIHLFSFTEGSFVALFFVNLCWIGYCKYYYKRFMTK